MCRHTETHTCSLIRLRLLERTSHDRGLFTKVFPIVKVLKLDSIFNRIVHRIFPVSDTVTGIYAN